MMVAEKLRSERIAKGFTQKSLGDKCGIAESTIRQYELGLRNPKLSTLEKISEALEISVYIFIEDSNVDVNKQRLLTYYEKLNDYGKQELLKRAEELFVVQ